MGACKSNFVTQNALAKRFGAKPYGEGCYLKLLWWKFWKEEPIKQGRLPHCRCQTTAQ